MPRTTIILPIEVIAAARQRGDQSEAIRESLYRYFELLKRGRAALRGRFTADQLAALLAISNGTIFEPHTLEGLLWNAEDARAVEMCGISDESREDLIGKLRSLSLSEHAALVDACERAWRAIGTGTQIEVGRLLD